MSIPPTPEAHDSAPVAGDVTAWAGDLTRLAEAGSEAAEDAEIVELLGALETLKSAAAAAQARLAVELDQSQRRAQGAAGVPPGRLGRGIGHQVALARRESPVRGQQHLGLAKVLIGEMPHAFARLAEGSLTEWRATLLARETACLELADRRTIDERLCADPGTLHGVGDRALVVMARRLAQQLDAQACVLRARRAVTERRVSIRPAPDTMAYLTALLPAAQGVAVYAALKAAADRSTAVGDPRSRGQQMADTLVTRITGLLDRDRSTGDQAAAAPPPVPVAVQIVMTDRTLLGGDVEPAIIPGYDPLPAEVARDLIADALDSRVGGWVRRLFTHPGSGELTARDSRARTAPPGLADLIRVRDGGSCRSLWCDAPIRHTDHVVTHDNGGPTSGRNGQGLCQSCNHAKQAPGWWSRPRPGPRHTVETTTPTGHRHRSQAPPLPGSTPGHRAAADQDYRLDLVLTA